ncbi:T9SS type A sorting domain-containing protein [Winogradskyella undariae]|uniref:T9SS type A sorting domain-containing protein n=1 Tax=Winogradskyella undariae TaxID=1285465 RepID=UPI00156AA63F|nr:T9SS type A sorting domain-containing protein [Winogradskyella undariae]NRR91100.1 T9SS type A sorting domain-containing protein [Winogradskyella undariae]
MKTRLQFLLLLLCFYTFNITAQNLGYKYAEYSFNNGSLINTFNPGNGDLVKTGTSSTLLTDRNGIANNAISLNGDTVYNSILPGGSGQTNFSVSLWMKTTTNNLDRTVWEVYNQTGNAVTLKMTTTGKLVSEVMLSGSVYNEEINTPTSLLDGNWHHIVVTLEKYIVNGGKLRVRTFIDGAEESGLLMQQINYGQIWTASHETGGITFGDGLDEVKYFNAPLSAIDVANLYESEIKLVDQNATGANDGSSWADAYTSLNTALQNNPGGEFWLKGDTYVQIGSVNAPFNLDDNQKIYGGFNGTETLLGQRDIVANPTILSGDINGDDDYNITFNNATRLDNKNRIVHVIGDNVIIDGITITGGNANGTTPERKRGSAVFVNPGAGQLVLRNCTVTKNICTFGGAISVLDGGNDVTVTFENSTFSDNLADVSSVLYARPSGGTIINFTSINSLYHNNTSSGDSNEQTAVLWLRNDTGGGYEANIINSTFVNNSFLGSNASSYDEPVIAVGSTNNSLHINIYNTIFWNNTNSLGDITNALGSVNNNTMTNHALVRNSLDINHFSIISDEQAILQMDPLFVDEATNDFRLSSASPAIDAGANVYLPTTVGTDLNYNTRIVNNIVDMGVYEYDASLSIVDLDFNKNSINLYPNPTTATLEIETQIEIKTISIYSILGKEVLKSNSKVADVSGLSSGVYLVKIIDLEGNQHVKRFIKE